jgi:hypothetical protein
LARRLRGRHQDRRRCSTSWRTHRSLVGRTRIRVHRGTAEVMARVYPRADPSGGSGRRVSSWKRRSSCRRRPVGPEELFAGCDHRRRLIIDPDPLRKAGWPSDLLAEDPAVRLSPSSAAARGFLRACPALASPQPGPPTVGGADRGSLISAGLRALRAGCWADSRPGTGIHLPLRGFPSRHSGRASALMPGSPMSG